MSKKSLGVGKAVRSKGHAKNDEFHVLARRKMVAQLYCEGKSQFELAKMCGVSQVQISNDLKIIRDAWLATAIMDWDDVKAKELAKLDLIEERMWEAYHRSYGTDTVVATSVKKQVRLAREENPGRLYERDREEEDYNSDIDGPDNSDAARARRKRAFGKSDEELEVVEETTDTKSRQLPGNPAFMTPILECIKLRCKLLGFLDDKNQTNINIGPIDWEAISKVRVDADPIEARIEKLRIIETTPVPSSNGAGVEDAVVTETVDKTH
jgi:hypothetical protein